MDAYYRYEIKAEAFRIMTGHMAPGKDAPPQSYPAPYEEREKVWRQWLLDNEECINAMLLAVDRIIDHKLDRGP